MDLETVEIKDEGYLYIGNERLGIQTTGRIYKDKGMDNSILIKRTDLLNELFIQLQSKMRRDFRLFDDFFNVRVCDKTILRDMNRTIVTLDHMDDGAYLCNVTLCIKCERGSRLQVYIHDLQFANIVGPLSIFRRLVGRSQPVLEPMITKIVTIPERIRREIEIPAMRNMRLISNNSNNMENGTQTIQPSSSQRQYNDEIPKHFAEMLNRLPQEDRKCSICLELIESDLSLTPCFHIFHKTCLDLHRNHRNHNIISKCPNCRCDI